VALSERRQRLADIDLDVGGRNWSTWAPCLAWGPVGEVGIVEWAFVADADVHVRFLQVDIARLSMALPPAAFIEADGGQGRVAIRSNVSWIMS
jgi:hypothetical protein